MRTAAVLTGTATDVPPAAAGPAASLASGPPPALADGAQLIGEFAGSGLKEPPSLARRADGQMIQLPPLLYAVLETVNGERTAGQIATQVSERVHRRLQAEDVNFLLAEKLRPMGLVSQPDGSSPPVPHADPFLALRFRAAVVPERVTAALGRWLGPLFHPIVVALALASLVAVDTWLFTVHGIAQPVRQTILHPAWILILLALLVASAAFHETGHAAGCSYSGAAVGRMGCGLYLAWPAFYTDVTDSYRLSRSGRLRTDLGGVYFNALFILACTGLYALTGLQALLVSVLLVHIEIAQQLLPVVRLDGYYIVSDLTGVPDLFARIGPILSSAVPWRKADDRVTALKGWVRTAVTTWVLVVVPVLLAELLLILLNLPRIIGTGVASARHLAQQVATAHGVLGAAVAVLQLLVLLIPLIGLALMLYRAARSGGTVLWQRTAGRPWWRAAALLIVAALTALLAYSWIPAPNYRPIGPHERGTLGDGISSAGRLLHRQPLPPPAVPSQPAATPPGPAGASPTARPAPASSPSTSAGSTSTGPAGASASPPATGSPTASAAPGSGPSAAASPPASPAASPSPSGSLASPSSPSPSLTSATTSSSSPSPSVSSTTSPTPTSSP